MFSAISATRLAIRDAIIVYGDMLFGCAPFVAPLVEGALFLVAFPAVFFDLEAAVRFDVRFTGAEATEAAGILDVLEVCCGCQYATLCQFCASVVCTKAARVQGSAHVVARQGSDSCQGERLTWRSKFEDEGIMQGQM